MSRTIRREPRRQSREYRKAIAARKAKHEAAKRAAVEQEAMHYTAEGDFSHLGSGRVPLNF